jgi:RNA-directed DNA polymerase
LARTARPITPVRSVRPLVWSGMMPVALARFYRSKMYPLLSRINAYLVRWIRKKYKRLRGKKKAIQCWRGIVERFPRMFAHWEWVPSVPRVW